MHFFFQNISFHAAHKVLQLGRDRASAMQAGEDVIALSVGEPDFAPHDVVLAATAEAATSGRTRQVALALQDCRSLLRSHKLEPLCTSAFLSVPRHRYTSTAGTAELRDAICGASYAQYLPQHAPRTPAPRWRLGTARRRARVHTPRQTINSPISSQAVSSSAEARAPAAAVSLLQQST